MILVARSIRRGFLSAFLFGTLRIQRTLPTTVSSAAFLYMLGIDNLSFISLYVASIFFFHASASAFNDVSDVKVDRIKAPERLLPSGKMSPRSLIVIASILFSAGVLTGALVDLLYASLAATLGLLYVLLYSFAIPMKSHPTGSFLYLSVSASALPFLGATIITRTFSVQAFAFTLLLTLLGTATSISSLRDIEADLLVARRTFAVVLGFDKARKLVAVTLFIPLAAYPFIPMIQGISYPALMLLALPGVIRLRLFHSVRTCNAPKNLREHCVTYRVLLALESSIIALGSPISRTLSPVF